MPMPLTFHAGVALRVPVSRENLTPLLNAWVGWQWKLLSLRADADFHEFLADFQEQVCFLNTLKWCEM